MTPLLLDQGLPRRTADVDLLDVARVQARACVTLDADFHAILATSGAIGPSVVRIRIERLKGGEVAALLSRFDISTNRAASCCVRVAATRSM